MAITNATRLANFGSGIGTAGAIITVDNANARFGVGTDSPTAMMQVGPNDAIIMDGIAGVVTATTFSGAFAGNITGNATGLTGTPSITVQDITAVQVSVSGTMTYEDVTNVDSVGIITAGLGLRVSSGGIQAVGVYTGLKASGVSTLSGWVSCGDTVALGDSKGIYFGDDEDLVIQHDGSNSYIDDAGTGSLLIRGSAVEIKKQSADEKLAVFTADGASELYYDNSKKIETTTAGAIITGIATVTVGTDLDGYKVEEGAQDGATSLNGEFDFKLENGHIQRYSAATGGNYFPDFKVSSSVSLSSVMDVGDVVSITLIVASSSHYCTTGIKIDDSTSNLDIDWVGGSAPSAANGSGFDLYAFTIMKTAATPAYHIIGNALGVA